MAGPSDPRPRRASLRGRGREILLGEPRAADPPPDEPHVPEDMPPVTSADAGDAPALDAMDPAVEEPLFHSDSPDEAEAAAPLDVQAAEEDVEVTPPAGDDVPPPDLMEQAIGQADDVAPPVEIPAVDVAGWLAEGQEGEQPG